MINNIDFRIGKGDSIVKKSIHYYYGFASENESRRNYELLSKIQIQVFYTTADTEEIKQIHKERHFFDYAFHETFGMIFFVAFYRKGSIIGVWKRTNQKRVASIAETKAI